ncbi:MAG: YihY/virulence factor BrkB family protein [Actinobacteria bacterium]|nr:YihY/virulence factor BrkB family protein [Actinomycetota bacterium]
MRTAESERGQRPSPDVEDGPDDPTDLSSRSWRYVARRTLREFSSDGCTDIAAALTYYGVLALFPGLIALISLVGLVGRGRESADTVLEVLRGVGAGSVADTLEPTLVELSSAPGAGVALVVGLLSALWSASGYVGAFGRAMNRMYEIGEGRPFWKLRPMMLALTALIVLLAAAVLVGLVVTGTAAEAVGDALGVGSTAVTVWSIVKWPVMLAVVVLVVALLYYATPNVEQPRFRWISVGAAFAIAMWVLVSAAFGFYVANFSSYNQTYGALAGVVVFLLWLWLTNLALLFGAELDSELQRGRQLEAGIVAERELQLPLRDTAKLVKDEPKEAELVEEGQRIRREHGPDGAADDLPTPD